MTTVQDFLNSKDIEFILHEHPPVYTCEDAEKHGGDIPGLFCKNLFLKGKKNSRYYLVIIPADKRANLKKIGETVGEKRLSFASPEELLEKLGLTPGAVSPFGLLNDKNHEIEVYIDQDVYDANIVSFHPNRNTASIELSDTMFHKFLQTIENKMEVIHL